MIRQVYQNETVLNASRRRISYVFDEYDNIVVSISGGKDSTVLAHLALKEANKRGRKIGLFFLDEEVVYDSTIKQIEYLMNLFPNNTIKLWYQIEFRLTNATSLKEGQLICWEAGKHKIWMRQKNKESIQHKSWDKEKETVRDKNKGFGFYDVLDNFQNNRPNTAFMVGLRAVESMNRWRAVSKNPGYKKCFWSTKLQNGSTAFYPIYDFNFHDIWKYIYDEGLKYSKIYDYMWKKGTPLNEIRVSSLITRNRLRRWLICQSLNQKLMIGFLKESMVFLLGLFTGKIAQC